MTIVEITKRMRMGDYAINRSISQFQYYRITSGNRFQLVTRVPNTRLVFTSVILDPTDILRDDWEVFIAK